MPETKDRDKNTEKHAGGDLPLNIGSAAHVLSGESRNPVTPRQAAFGPPYALPLIGAGCLFASHQAGSSGAALGSGLRRSVGVGAQMRSF